MKQYDVPTTSGTANMCNEGVFDFSRNRRRQTGLLRLQISRERRTESLLAVERNLLSAFLEVCIIHIVNSNAQASLA